MLTPEQKKLRFGRIGSSSIAALTGHSPWMAPIDVYRECTEPDYERKRSDSELWQMELGSLLEPVVLELYRRRTGSRTAQVGTLQHPKLEYVCASPDALALLPGQIIPLEAKTCAFRRDEWGVGGTDQVPPQYIVQATWQMRLLRDVGHEIEDHCDIPVLFFGSTLEIFQVNYDADLADNLLELAREFYVDHIKPRVPPPLDASPSFERYFRDIFPRDTRPMRVGSERERQLVKLYAELQEREKLVGGEKQKYKNALMAAIGEAGGLDCGEYRVTWQADKNGKRTLRVQAKSGKQKEEVAA